MKYSFATLGCPDWSVQQIAERAAAMGFDGVELRTADDGLHLRPDATSDDCRQIKALFDSAGVPIVALMGYTDFVTPNDVHRTAAETNTLKLIGLSEQLGRPVVRVFGGRYEGDRQAAIARVAESLSRVAPAAEQAGVTLAIETHDDWCEPANLLAVLDQVASPNVGICCDFANMVGRHSAAAAWQTLQGRTVHVHLKDIASDKHDAVLMGQGIADVAAAVRLLRDSGYGGFVSFEWEKRWQPTIADPVIALPHFLSFVRQAEAS